nr:MAG TPA: hypothetical protein [Caudoviricetes sp.]
MLVGLFTSIVLLPLRYAFNCVLRRSNSAWLPTILLFKITPEIAFITLLNVLTRIFLLPSIYLANLYI